jgi:hypothetical protein
MIDEYIIIGFDVNDFVNVRMYNENIENYQKAVSYGDQLSASSILHSSIRKGLLKSGQVIKIKRAKSIDKVAITQLYKLD